MGCCVENIKFKMNNDYTNDRTMRGHGHKYTDVPENVMRGVHLFHKKIKTSLDVYLMSEDEKTELLLELNMPEAMGVVRNYIDSTEHQQNPDFRPKCEYCGEKEAHNINPHNDGGNVYRKSKTGTRSGEDSLHVCTNCRVFVENTGSRGGQTHIKLQKEKFELLKKQGIWCENIDGNAIIDWHSRKTFNQSSRYREGPAYGKCRKQDGYFENQETFAKFGQPTSVVLDHIRGTGCDGKDVLSNIQVLCYECHQEKTQIDFYLTTLFKRGELKL